MDDDLPEWIDGLNTVVGNALGSSSGAVASVTQLSGGASRETFDVRLAGGDVDRLILQRDRPREVLDRGGMGVEAAVLRAAFAAGVPVPELLASSADDDLLGAPFLLSRFVAGETIARKLLRDDEFAVARPRLAADWGRALARLHRIDPTGIGGLEPRDEFRRFRLTLDAFGDPHPAFELAFRWLEANRPPHPDPPRLVHGDFRLGNVIVDAEGLAACIDWEIAHIGDPLLDLGWLCTPAWRFGSDQPVGGMGPYEDLFSAYEAESGQPLDREAVHWWVVFGALRWGIMCKSQANRHLNGVTPSHELAAIGRRVCENEYDVLRLLP